jgi:hypothetical protein
VIHVQLAKCHPLPEGASARGGNETGFGPPREVRQKAAHYEIEPPPRIRQRAVYSVKDTRAA